MEKFTNLDYFLTVKTAAPTILPQRMGKGDFAKLFLNFANAHVLKATKNRKKLDTSGENLEIWQKIMRHQNRVEASELDQIKGLAFFGSVGTGKTLFLKTIKDFASSQGDKIKLYSAYDLVQVFFNDQTEWTRITKEKVQSFIIDEVGDEPAESQVYGNKESVVYRFLKIKLDQLECGEDFRLYFSTNLTVKQLEERYGDRILSRLKEYCEFIVLDKNKRNE